jgi:hypothetical protein
LGVFKLGYIRSHVGHIFLIAQAKQVQNFLNAVRLCYHEWMPDNTTKINIGTHKALKYNDCIIDLFKNSIMASTARKTSMALSKTCALVKVTKMVEG